MLNTGKTWALSVSARRPRRRSGFSLVELLTVIFIIALLIGILIPSLNAARNAAKKTSSKSMHTSLGVGLEMFKNDNGADFPQSNGYPPSFSHPPLSAFNRHDAPG
jgi:prepilin-type N-terminal cleavage/methylation domain-containing protein